MVELDIEDNRDDDDFLQVGETETDKKERKAYKKPDRGESQWMQQFMQNNNYKIENVADGSCFMLLEMPLKV